MTTKRDRLTGQKFIDGSAAVTLYNEPAALDQRLARFDAAGDMPADITSSANVAADLITMDTFSSTATLVQLLWHGIGGQSDDGTNGIGPAAIGALVAINAGSAVEAEGRLTYTDLTGGGSSSAGKADVLMVSASCPVAEFHVDPDVGLASLHAIGIPNTTGPAILSPCFLEVRVIG